MGFGGVAGAVLAAVTDGSTKNGASDLLWLFVLFIVAIGSVGAVWAYRDAHSPDDD